MGREPRGEGGRVALGQHVEDLVSLGIDYDRSVDVTTPEREVVHANGARLGRCRVGQVHHPAQQRGAAGRDAHDLSEAGTGPAGQGQPDLTHRLAQPLGDPAVAAGQSRRHLLHERPPAACRGRAEEPTDPQGELRSAPGSRQVCRKPQVGAVNPLRPLDAVGADSASGHASGFNTYRLAVRMHGHDRDAGDRREQ
jgi:hypothetical protein